MICEPYICIKGRHAGEIRWQPNDDCAADYWRPYADFEREKLRELGSRFIRVTAYGYQALVLDEVERDYTSNVRIGYDADNYAIDTESNRLLKRAEFLKAVCEKEGVEWVPSEQHGPKWPQIEPDRKKHAKGECWCGEHHFGPEHLTALKRLIGLNPERDTYTKAEVDAREERLLALLRNQAEHITRMSQRLASLEVRK